jgi:hypothetical protein
MAICKRYFVIVIFVITVIGCKKNSTTDPPQPVTIPQVTTTAVVNITATTATAGGTIVSDGGSKVTASGVCWSKTNPNPTLADDTIKTSTATGAFTGVMKNLNSVTNYYVRAYAINSEGTGYGNTVSFNSLNKAPEAKNIVIAGNMSVSQKIVVRYSYIDAENDTQGATSFQWYIANDTTGAPVTPINNATDSLYIIQPADENKFLQVAIIPKARTGSSPGTEARSFWVGPVKAPVSVTFVYNGRPVTYGVIISTTTQRQWLDRNLGAPNAANALNDWANEGDLFQWGRPDDGHQLINRAATSSGTTAVNGTTTTLSTIDAPGHPLFILPATAPFDWHLPQADNLWQVSGGVNNVCPAGWHVPTQAEWQAENLSTIQDAYTKLKITMGGTRSAIDGKFVLTVDNGAYWTSSIFTGVSQTAFSFNFTTNGVAPFPSTINPNASGLSVRCIKN